MDCEISTTNDYFYTQSTIFMNRIQRILRQQGRTQAYLCRMLDKSANTISLWCRNKVQPSIHDLYRIAELLDCKVTDLLIEKDQIEQLKEKDKRKNND